MATFIKVTMTTTCFLIFVILDMLTSLHAALNSNNNVELWLEDYTRIKVADGDIQSDSPHGLSDEETPEYTCPFVPPESVTSSTINCLLPTCTNDLDCDWPKMKCCNNGCLNVCVHGVPPPPYVDWRREPPRDPQTGISWLIDDTSDDPGDDDDKNGDDEDLKKAMAQSHMVDRCDIDNKQYLDGTKFIHKNYICKCHKGLIDCDVRDRR